MNLKRVKRMVPIQVGERTAYEVDRDGKWLISWGTPITINGFDFFFVPISNAKGGSYSSLFIGQSQVVYKPTDQL